MIEPREVDVTCPFCDSTDTAGLSLFGMGEMTMQCECRACGSTFELVKWK